MAVATDYHVRHFNKVAFHLKVYSVRRGMEVERYTQVEHTYFPNV